MKARILPLLALVASVSALAFNPVFDQAANQFRDETSQFQDTMKQNRRASQSMRQAYKVSKQLSQQAEVICDDLMTEQWDEDTITKDMEQLRSTYTEQANAMDQVTQGMTFPVAIQFAQIGQDLNELENQWEDCRDSEDQDFADDLFDDDMDQDDGYDDDMDQDDVCDDHMSDDECDEAQDAPETAQNPWADPDFWDQFENEL